VVEYGVSSICLCQGSIMLACVSPSMQKILFPVFLMYHAAKYDALELESVQCGFEDR
jgi:hypothetical protein